MPALAASALLLAAGCSSAPQNDRSAAADEQIVADLSTAAPDDAPLAVAAAPDDAPTATARPGGGSDGKAKASTLSVASYDSRTGRAVISSNGGKATESSPSPTNSLSTSKPAENTESPQPPTDPASPSASAPATTSPAPSEPAPAESAPSESAPAGTTAVGDVIASAPAPGAPNGLLAKVTKVIGETAKGTEVDTEPAQLNALLADETAKGSVPVAPSAFQIDKLLPDVDISWSKTKDVHIGPKGATVPLGSLRLDVSAALPTVGDDSASATASVSGFVQVAPQVDFTYGGEGAAASPLSAYLGVSGDWSSGWALRGRAAAATAQRIPFAKLHADPVLQVGPVPVVVNLDLTCYVQITSDGKVTVDVEQSVEGDFKAGGTFGPAQGWTPVNSSTVTSTPVRTSVTAAGSVKAALGAEASVGLYGAVGVVADLAPFVRGEAQGSITGTDGDFEAKGAWALYGGIDLTGTLRLQLSVFGTPLFKRDIPLGALHREWKLAGSPA
ncbi:hypothetical protein [Streptomyces sp. ST1015]|uniref:hypothetical protein n=1 Tax=unclassified Streptomyces TaxID=2593676 RepID=UPI001CA73908|nr:hypothetical protein [Streptomyces sp. ST1015]QZZ30618.1 hypothetical protein A7X85_34250 [Streptomyces sp. ST1015]